MRHWLDDWLLGREEAARRRAEGRLQAAVWPPGLLDVLHRLSAPEGAAYLVGGTVRDVLLGRRAQGAFDVATDRRPEEVMERFARVEPVGLRHGTVLILEGELRVECTTFRREGAYSDARRPDRVEFTADPLEDLDRRDLTANALAFAPAAGRLLDPHGGAADIEARRLRAVGEAIDRFREDALRPLRVARLAATLGMEPVAELREALGRVTRDPGIQVAAVSAERVRDELLRMLEAPRPSRGLELLREAGLLAVWLPELARCRGVPQNRFHAFDVYEHSLRACDAAPDAKPAVRWAALLHDIGKPDTRVERRGDGTFYGHEIVGAELADARLAALRFPVELRARIVHLIRQHMFGYRPDWTDAAVRRWLRRVGPDAVADLFDLRIADGLGKTERAGFPRDLEALRDRVTRVIETAGALEVVELAVDGRDVMRELGIAPGPRVGAELEALLEGVLERPEANTREHLLDRLRAIARQDAASS